ncbi:MAG: 5'/3'-nucleotidase SurE [Myxococcaceae bacterium]|nr:5'/3'-nucleotidase SurE [Myxococcaceae bacterium]
MRILVSNDDGAQAPGLQALVEAVSDLGEVWVVAPESEQSASSHSLSLHRPLRIRKLKPNFFAVDGTPADCVHLAVNHLMKDKKPSLVLSGINHGPNLADDIFYSGTVAAAREGALLGFPAIAFSLAARSPWDFAAGAKFARSLAQAALHMKLPGRALLNVNIPGQPKDLGYEITQLGRHSYGSEVVEKTDPRGRRYYWIGGSDYDFEPIEGSDCMAIHTHQRISVTPLRLDLTGVDHLPMLRSWQLEGFAGGA